MTRKFFVFILATISIISCNFAYADTIYNANSVSAVSGSTKTANYVDMGGNGSWLEWNNVTGSGVKYLQLQFANGEEANRNCQIIVNGTVRATLLFPSTTDWNAKGYQVAYKINLPNSVNTVRVKAITANGGPNIFQMTVIDNYYTGDWSKIPQILANIKPPTFRNEDFNVTNYGAVGNGTVDCYTAFKNAIAACNRAGGGRVYVPAGTFLVNGPIHLKSNVNLHLASTETQINFTTDKSKYLVGDAAQNGCVLVSWEGTRLYNYSPAIYANKADNIAVTGSGTFWHRGAETWTPWTRLQTSDRQLTRDWNNNNTPLNQRIAGPGMFLRAHMLQFYECNNILIENVTFQDAGFWVVHTVFANNVTVRRIKYKNCFNANNDGVDPEFSTNVHIHDIAFANGDDNVAIKAGRDLEGLTFSSQGYHSQNIVIENCAFRGHNAVCVGSEASGSVYDVYAQNNTYAGSVVEAIYLKTNRDRGGEYRRIYLRDSVFDTSTFGIDLTTNYKGENTYNRIPYMADVFMKNVFIRETSNFAIRMLGLPSRHLNNIKLENVFVYKAAKDKSIINADNVTLENVWINGIKQ